MSPVNPWFVKCAGLRSAALAALCVLLWSPPIRAEPAAVRQSDADRTTTEARRHFEQGREFLDAGLYDKAIAEFETALSYQRAPELLFNIAQAFRLKGDAKQARETYKRFIEVSPRGPIADEARGHIEALTRQIEDDARAREAERQREEAERRRREAERPREEAERQRREIERRLEEAEQQRHETEREEQAHRRRTGVIAVGVGSALSVAGFVLIAALGNDDINRFNTADAIGTIGLCTGLLGLIPYGTLKILYNPDPGPFQPTSTISKGVALTFSF